MPLTCRRVQSSVSDEVTPQAAAGSLWTERRLVTDLSVRLFKCARKHTLRLINSTDFTTSGLLEIQLADYRTVVTNPVYSLGIAGAAAHNVRQKP